MQLYFIELCLYICQGVENFKSWMECTSGLTREYMNGAKTFLDFSFTIRNQMVSFLALAMSAIMYSARLEMRSKLIY